MSFSFEVLHTATTASSYIGEEFVSTAAIYSSPRWWQAVENMRPDVDVGYFAISTDSGLRAVIPAYRYRGGRGGGAYAADWGTPSNTWRAKAADKPCAMLGGCSRLFTRCA